MPRREEQGVVRVGDTDCLVPLPVAELCAALKMQAQNTMTPMLIRKQGTENRQLRAKLAAAEEETRKLVAACAELGIWAAGKAEFVFPTPAYFGVEKAREMLYQRHLALSVELLEAQEDGDDQSIAEVERDLALVNVRVSALLSLGHSTTTR